MARELKYRAPYGTHTIAVASATVIEPGDMIYLSSGNALPASTATLWNTNEATTAAALKDAFLGIAITGSQSGETTPITYMSEGVFEMDCASDSYAVGALVGGEQDGANLYLYAQQVKDAASAAGAIGIVTEAAPAASTRVLVSITSQVLAGVKIGE